MIVVIVVVLFNLTRILELEGADIYIIGSRHREIADIYIFPAGRSITFTCSYGTKVGKIGCFFENIYKPLKQNSCSPSANKMQLLLLYARRYTSKTVIHRQLL